MNNWQRFLLYLISIQERASNINRLRSLIQNELQQ